MTYRGRVQDGVILLEEPIDLPNGTQVRVEPMSQPGKSDATKSAEPPSWAEVFKDLLGKSENLPEDLAENHDHYIRGTPKK